VNTLVWMSGIRFGASIGAHEEPCRSSTAAGTRFIVD
jgi:hypothetical protein